MKTFKWCIRPNFEVNNEPKVDEMEFGDGYKQRRPSGINALLQAYSVTVKVKNKERFDVHEFLREHQASSRFYLTTRTVGNRLKLSVRSGRRKSALFTRNFRAILRKRCNATSN